MTHPTVPHTAATSRGSRFGAGVLVGVLASLAVAAAVVGSAAGTRLATASLGSLESCSYTQPFDGATMAEVRLEFGAGQFTVGALDSHDDSPAKATHDGPSASLPEPTYRVRDGVGELAYVIRDTNEVDLPFIGRAEEHARMDVQLAHGAPLTLDTEAGAAESRLELSALQITRLDLQTGMTNTRVRLPDVPQGVAADIQVSDGLAGRQIDERRFRPMGGGHYRSPEYESAPNRVDMHIELGLASLTIQ